MHTGGFTTQLSPDACKIAINAALYEEYSRTEQPAYLSATDELFYKQDTTDLIAFIWEEDSNVGEFQATGEQEEILDTDSFIGNQKTKVSQKWTKQVPVSDEAFRTDRIGKRAQIGKNMGDRARLTQDRTALLETYGDAFAGSLNTTPDGRPLADNSHVPLKGANLVDNLETGQLNPDNAWTTVVSLAGQRAQDGDAGSHVLEGALCPFLLYKTMKEVMNSQLIANSAENNLNIFDTDYGNVQIRASIFLGSAYNSNSNANTSYHFISRDHMIMRKVLYGLTSNLIPPEMTANDTYLMRAKYHESHFPGSWTGYVGNNGSAAS